MLEIYRQFKDSSSLKQHEVNEILHKMDEGKIISNWLRHLQNQPKFKKFWNTGWRWCIST